MAILINNFSEIESIKDSLTFENIRHKYGTGRSSTFATSNGKKTSYRHGVMTEIGDVGETVWMRIVEYLIEKAHETVLFNNLFEWIRDTIKWHQSEYECKKYALQLHAARIFDDPKWVDYKAFNAKYRPKILNTVKIK